MKDWRGTDITVGARVVYPVRNGSSLHLTEATVIAVNAVNDRLRVEHVRSSGWRARCTRRVAQVTLTALGQVTVIPTRGTVEEVISVLDTADAGANNITVTHEGRSKELAQFVADLRARGV